MEGKAQEHQQAKLNYEEAKAVYDKLCATFETRLIAVEADRSALVQEVRTANENRSRLIEEHAKCREETIWLKGKVETSDAKIEALEAKIETLEERLAKVDRHTENNIKNTEGLAEIVKAELKAKGHTESGLGEHL